MDTRFLILHQCLYFHMIIIIIILSSSLVCFSKTPAAGNYIIHMNLDAMPSDFSDRHSWYMSALDSITGSFDQPSTTTASSSSSSSKLLYSYKHVIHGFSASLTPTELQTLTSHPGFLHATPDTTPIVKDTTYTPEFLGLTRTTSSSSAWNVSRYGADIIIGLVDTGIWPESKSFDDYGLTRVPRRWKGTCENGTHFPPTLCNNKLVGARYFNRGLSHKDPDVVIAMNSTRDTEGHGTHTSSTAAGAKVVGANYFGYGTGSASGMAPDARVAMYKALWEEGDSAADIIAAIDAAIEDGVDVLSISLGMNVRRLDADPVAIATFAAAEKGVFVAVSAGNEGPFRGVLHNGSPWVTTVAAGTTDREFGGTVTLGDDTTTMTTTVIGSTLYPLNFDHGYKITDAKLVYMDTCDDMTKLKKLKKDDKVVVVCLDVNGTAVYQQVDNLNDVHIAGAIFITDFPLLSPSIMSDTEYPAIFLDHKAGKSVTDYIIKHSDHTGNISKPILATLEFGKTFFGESDNVVAPKVAFYSSRGPSRTCPQVLKPDLMAPGDMILASWTEASPVTSVVRGKRSLYSKFNVDSGTSMSTPHVAGVAALLKGAHPDWTPAAIRSALMTTADPMDSSGKPIKDHKNRVASALAMGAGQVNPNKALNPGLVYDAQVQDYVNFLCGLNYTETQIRVITKRSARVECSADSAPPRARHRPAGDLNYPSFMVLMPKEKAAVEKEFVRVVTNVGNGPAEYQLKVDEGLRGDGGGAVEVEVHPDRLVFKEKNEKVKFKVRIKARGEGGGAISWVETKGRYTVRSPIIVTTHTRIRT